MRHEAELRQFRHQVALQKQQQKQEFEQHRQQIITAAVSPAILYHFLDCCFVARNSRRVIAVEA